MNRRLLRVAVVIGVIVAACGSAWAAHYRSPWDARNVPLTDVPYTCPAVVHLSRDLTTEGFYSDGKSSVIDPAKWKAYAESSGPYKALGEHVVDAADAYRASGSRAAAECALNLMRTAARDGVFTGKMSSRQAYYVQGWVIGAVALSYLKVRDTGLAASADEKLLFPWFKDVARQTIGFYEGNHAKNNHLNWAGLEAIAVGTATDDKSLFNWGVGTYRVGVDQIQPDGSLPEEMRRGQRALHYHLYALAPLVYIAEFGEVNGLHLYAERDHALARLVHLSIQGLENNEYFAKATGIAQDTPHGMPAAEQISWAEIWQSRFPDPAIAKLLSEATSMSYMYLGGLPPGIHPSSASRGK